MNEDPFGPVAIPNRFDTLDAAIAEANRLPFGLAAHGCTRSEAVACRLPVEAKAGMMTITHPGLALPDVPFDGLKEPGYGTESGSQALDACFDTRFVSRKA